MRRILIVDDDPLLVKLVSELVQSAGFFPVTAGNGMEGLKQLGHHDPHLVILDLNMPELDGMQTCRMIRAQKKYKNLPILILTAKKDISDMLQARRMGADDYLAKPFESEVLINKIKRLLHDELSNVP